MSTDISGYLQHDLSCSQILQGERLLMNETLARRFTGISCLVAAVALILEVPLYFVYSGPPPDSNVLARRLIQKPIEDFTG